MQKLYDYVQHAPKSRNSGREIYKNSNRKTGPKLLAVTEE